MKDFETEIYPDMPPFGTSLYHKEIQPKNQSFLQMLRFSLFPYFQSYTFCFFWLILVTFVFFYSLSYKPLSNPMEEELLRISQASLFQLGQNYPFYIVKKYHYYRLLTCMVLFRNFYHYLMVCIGILTLGSFVEKIIGFKRCFVLVIFSGVMGMLTSNTVNKNATLQSTTPVCGLVGFIVAFYLVEKEKLWKYYFDEKKQMFVLLIAYSIIIWHMTYTFSNVNQLPNIFAFIVGFIFYFADSNESSLIWQRLLSRIILAVHIAFVILVFFFNSSPERIQF